MGKRIARYRVVDVFHTKRAKRRYKFARTFLAGVLTFGAVVTSADFAGAADAVSLIASASTVAPGSTVDLTASMPVVSAGSTTQTLTQTIDPTKVKLTSASDITYPVGWTLSYSTDGTTFSTTAPTSLAGWAAVKAVRATGAVNSNGSDSNGYQIATGTATGSAVNTAPASLAITNIGDGYQAFFDPSRTRVFNLFHHSAGDGITAPLDCYLISTGQRCVGFPFNYGGNTDEAANGVVIGSTIWAAGRSGFYCIDISAVLANTANSPGGGSPAGCFSSGTSALVPGTSGKPLVWFAGGTPLGSPNETKIFALDDSAQPRALVYCIDTASRALCSTPSVDTGILGSTYSGLAAGMDFSVSSTLLVENRLYVMIGSRTASNQATGSNTVNCLVLETWQRCPGWTGNYSAAVGLASAGKFADIPNAQGTSRGVCLLVPTAATTAGWPCWNALGQMFTPSSVNLPYIDFGAFHAYGNPVRIGTRLFVGNANYQGSYQAADPSSGGQILCFDASLNNGTGGRCNSAASNLGPTASNNTTLFQNYNVTPDPQIPDCLWITRHTRPIIRAINIKTGVEGCSDISPISASFSGTAIVPRMACQASSQPIRSWQSFTLTSAGTGTFTSAKLTVKNSSGVALASWTDIPLTLNTALDLSTLSPTDTGTTPTFAVSFAGITGSITTATAQVKVVGDAPQLCTKVTAVYPCPTGVGPISSLSDSVASVSAAGSSVLGGVTTTLTSANQSVTVTAPALSTCTSSITGRAGDAGGGASGNAIAGVTVSLLDSSGNPVLVGWTPVTTTTASDGTYSFANLVPASYKVKFNEPGTPVLASSTVVSGASGTTTGAVTVNAAATMVTSNVSAIAVGTNAVVNALYSIPATATADTSNGGQGVAQTINVLANDNAASGATLTATSVKLCGTSPAQTPPSCSQTSLTTADGSYSVNASTGVVTFTPNASFTGTATVVPTYQVTDSASNVVSSTITASVVPAPAASSDTSTGGVNQTQTKNVLANDTAANGSGGFAASNPVSLCTLGSTVSCTSGSSVTISGQGTYTVNASGVITFTPVSGYTGTPTPVTYVVTDALGGKSVSTYQPTVVPAPTATNDTTTGTAGATQSMNLLTNDAGAPSSGGLAPTNPVSLCTSGSSTSCTTGTTISNSAGTYTLDPMTGVISFTPASGFTGTAPAVTYVVTDALGSKATATYTPTVVAAPTANTDTSSGGVNQTQTKNLLTNDSAATGQSITSVDLCTSGATVSCTTGTTVTNASGTYTVDPATGVVTYSPANGYTGTPSPISYVVTDGLGGKAVSTYTPTVFAAPTATDKTTVGVMGATQTSNLFTGDTVNGAAYSLPGSLAIALCTSGTATSCTTGNSVSNASGTYTLNPVTGVISYVPANGYSGTPQAITYVITDGVGQKVVATYTPTVVPPPTPVADTTTGAWNTTQILNLISNSAGTSDTAGAGSGGFAALNPVKLCGPSDTAPNCSIDSSSSTGLVISGQGTYRISNSGVVTFTPIATFTGTATPITYSVTDSLGQKAATTYTPTVANPNAPLASADATSGPMGATQSVNVLTNDAPGIANNADLSLVASSVKLCDPTTTPAQVAPHCTATTVNVAGVGLYSVNSSGVVSFTPDANFSGTPTSLSYQVADTTGQIATAAYTPTVIPPPTVVADTSSGAWDVNQTISVLGNDSAAPGATLVASSVKLCGPADTAPNCTATSVTTSEGTYTVNSNGTVSFDPLPSFSGTATQPVTYSVTDSLGQKASTTITPSVTPPTAPTARPETKQLLPNTTVAFTTISGASGLASGTQLDPASVCLVDPISQSCVTSLTTSDGTWVVDPTNGVVTYNSTSTTPGTQVAVTYRVSDVTGHTASSTLTPVVPGAPTARPDTSIAEQGAVQWISPLGNDSPGSASVGLDPATVALCGAQQSPPNCSATTLTVAGEGTYTVDAFGLVRFTPEPNFTGVATPVTYQVADTLGQRATSTITVTVEPPPYPSAVVDTGSAPAGHTVTFKPWLNDSAGTKPSTTSLPDPSLVVPSIRLCSANQSAPHCSATRITTVDGTYVLNTSTGEVVFTPASGFIGTATQPPTYQISNDWTGLAGAGTTTALLIPTITPVGSPAASIDSTTTRPGGSVVITPVNNDKPGNASLNPTTIRLCSATEVAPNCTQTRVTTDDGTYVVNTRTGKVTFTALANFRGITTIPYVIFDAGGYAANSQIIVTVKSESQPPQDNSDSDHPLANTGGNLPEQSLVITTLLIIGIKFIRPTQRNKQAA